MAGILKQRRISRVLPRVLPLPLLLVAGCLFQGEDPGKQAVVKKAFPGPCIEIGYEKGDDGAVADWKTRYLYDDRGSLISKGRLIQPGDLPGRTESWSYTYDANGFVLTQSRDDFDDGEVDSKLTFLRDAQGRILRRELESGVDSVHRSLTLFEYDGYGNMLSEKFDNGMDGSFEEIFIRTYDEKGDTLSLAIGDDRDGDGVMRIDRSSTYTYDKKGNLLTHLFSGPPQVLRTHHYTYDANGYPEKAEIRNDVGYPVKHARYVFDARGRKLSEEIDEHGDGTVEEKYAWNADGYQLLDARDNDGDGVFDRAYRSAFDPSGNRLSVELDSALDGIPEMKRTFSFDCWKTD